MCKPRHHQDTEEFRDTEELPGATLSLCSNSNPSNHRCALHKQIIDSFFVPRSQTTKLEMLLFVA